MRPRIIGIETEYNIQKRTGNTISTVDAAVPCHVKTVREFVPNGGRLYRCSHLMEYATPECLGPLQAALYDAAGMQILYGIFSGNNHRISRSNRGKSEDGSDTYCASHENYSVTRKAFEERHKGLIPFISPFLATRIFAGGGWHDGETFQIFQRADAMVDIAGLSTTSKRNIVNERDEPHADKEKYARLHLICGDSSMSEYANALKMATTCMVLDMIEDGCTTPIELEDPVQAMKDISRDFRCNVKRTGGRTISAIDVQREYLRQAQRHYVSPDKKTARYMKEWESTLDYLEMDPLSMRQKVDWATQLWIFESMEGLDGEDRKNISACYHEVRPERNYHTLFDDSALEKAMSLAPRKTRAYIRSEFVKSATSGASVNMNWEKIGEFEFPDPLDSYAHMTDGVRAYAKSLVKFKPPDDITGGLDFSQIDDEDINRLLNSAGV